MAKNTKQIYQEVTDTIVEELEQGRIPWKRPWAIQGGNVYRNLVSKKPYHGINPFLLNLKALNKGYKSPWWLTYNQAKAIATKKWEKAGKPMKTIPVDEDGSDTRSVRDMGGVRKGERGTTIIYWQMIEKKIKGEVVRDKKGKPELLPLLRYWTVFNLEQTTGIDAPEMDPEKFEPLERAQAIIDQYEAHPEYRDAEEAYYDPSEDVLGLPKLNGNPESYYSKVYPQLIHSTGHSERLCRYDIEEYGPTYDKEALIGELGSAMLAGLAGITVPESVDNAKEYIQGWLLALADNNRLVVQAAAKARHAADYIIGPDEEEE